MSEQAGRGIQRRQFLVAAGAAAASLALGGRPRPARAQAALVNPPLPYPEGALEPVISAKTVSFHYGKHTQAYYDNAARLLAGSPLAGQPLDRVILAAAADEKLTGLFNNAAQAWNHTFYWAGLKPGGGGPPTGRLAEAVRASFGDLAGCLKALTEAATTQFGSGWAWLAAQGAKLQVVKTANAANPLTLKLQPLWALDVWEHAYYLDYQNRRADYVKAVLERLINWDFVAKNLG